jgi:hypothetical protein
MHRLNQIVFTPAERWLRQKMQNDFAINRCLEHRPVVLQFISQLGGVGQISRCER